MKGYVETHWCRYYALVHAGTGVQQAETADMRRAFYAGAQSMLRIVCDMAAEEEGEVTDTQLARLSAISDELALFATKIMRGEA